MSEDANKLRDALLERIVIFDGAIGTEIYKRHFFINQSFESLSLSNPEVILEIHSSYRDAGAEVLTTNSYGANYVSLSRFGLGERVREINQRAVELARMAGGADTLIAGSAGPIGDTPHDTGMDEDRRTDMLTEQVEVLRAAGADFIIFETLASVRDVKTAAEAAARVRAPYVLSLSVDRLGESSRGETMAQLLQPVRAAAFAPTALGINCGEGPESSLAALEILVRQADLPIIVQPNAGVPKHVEGRTLYMTSPEYFSTYAMRYADLGARGVGGCCGTGPDHIRSLAAGIRPKRAGGFSGRIKAPDSGEKAALKPAAPTAEKSALGAKLAAREWIATVEIVPPRGYDLSDVLAKSAACREAGVDAINIPDGPRASSRISPIVTAARILDAGIEPILHFCCRDKNLIGMQADLLGCAALGIRNILFITGDPPKLGDYPFASGVFDADSVDMAGIQARLNRGVDLGGKPIDPPTMTLIGVGADPNAIDMEREIRRTRAKVEAGAEFIITQPVFAPEALLRFLEAISAFRVPVIAGIWPLASYRNAEFMKNEVPGVTVPDTIMRRMAAAKSREDQKAEGITIARECVTAIRPHLQGVQVSAPFGNVQTALAVLAG
ncbi:MAG: bifunctional homocysteine S-methyltransferase/methylenetetrahydrofolate reductase [Lentisphaerae bacterium]|nr:bifunctional homocysteine S-methyltransferase/methylenetetrahydrofolate reductase [Lentisphaerota bacterium]